MGSKMERRTSSRKFRDLVRQNSTKWGDVAEAVVLPPNRRSLKRPHPKTTNAEIDLERSESMESIHPNKRSFPFLFSLIALIQILVFLLSKEYTWLSLCYDPFRRHEIWRFVSVALVHGSLFHLLGNLLFILILGLLLEVVHGWKRIGAIFLAGILGGSLAITVLQPDKYTVGASAGVYGLLTAHLVTILLNWAQMEQVVLRLACLLTYIVFDVSFAYFLPNPNVSHVGHAGGAIGGFVAAVFILRNFEVLSWEKTFQKVIAGIGTILFLAIVIVNVCFPGYYFRTEFNFDYVDTYLKYVFNLTAVTAWELCQKEPKCLEGFVGIINSTNSTMA